MRIATITNFAYVATVVLTLSSGVALFMASSAEREERAAVAENRVFDTLTDDLEKEAYALTDLARDAVIKPQPENVQSWKTRNEQDISLENHLASLRDAGATSEEILILRDALSSLDQLEDEQRIAIASVEAGKASEGVNLLFSADYEEKLEEAEYRFAHFRSLSDQRTDAAVAEATKLSLRLRTLSEIMVGLTAVLFLFVLGFIIKHRMKSAIWRRPFACFGKMALHANALSMSATQNGRHVPCWRV